MKKFSPSTIRSILDAVKTTPSERLESTSVEFKEFRNEQALHNSKELAEELSALGNAGGGLIVVGVRDSSHVPSHDWPTQLVGFPKADAIVARDRLAGKIRPNVELHVANFDYEGKSFLTIEICGRCDSVISTSSGKTCIRDGRSSRPMLPDELAAAVKNLSTFDWSAEIVADEPQSHLDWQLVAEAKADFELRRNLSDPVNLFSYLEAVGATRNGKLLAGGLLFLGREAAIRSVLGDYEYRFSWKTKGGELRVNDVWRGSLWEGIHRATRHFNHCNQDLSLEHRGKFFTAPLLDPVAFHEAYLNALVHRDYSSDGMVSVTFSDEHLMIASPGDFYGGVTAENIVRHEPRHRNKVLAKILMSHHLVDRAGMGVLRMGLRSLMYGRAFPVFQSIDSSVEVTMDAEYLRAPITALTLSAPNKHGLAELIVLISVYETGVSPVKALEARLRAKFDDTWQTLAKAVDAIDQVELCGTNDGIFVRVVPQWKDFMCAGKLFRTTASSDKHVAVYSFLRQHGEASNADLRELLVHNHASQTSKFLREARYLRRKGSGQKSRWYLVDGTGQLGCGS